MSLIQTHYHGEFSLDLASLNTKTYRVYDEHTLWQLKDNNASYLVITDEEHRVINQVSASEFTMLNGMTYTVLILSTIILLISCMNLTLKRQSRLTYFALFSALICLLVLTNKPLVGDVSRSIAMQITLILSLLSAYLVGYKWLLKTPQSSKRLLVFASQSGSGLALAKSFHQASGAHFDMRCISKISPKLLEKYTDVLFVASTYGEGESPEKARRFTHQLEQYQNFHNPPAFSVLALGDSHYQYFCAFGHYLAQLMNLKGAATLFKTMEVDKLDETAIKSWWQGVTGQLNINSKPLANRFSQVRLLDNTCLNPTQSHRHAHRITLEKANLAYQPGDLLEVKPQLNKQTCLMRLQQLNLNPNEKIRLNGKRLRLIDALLQLEWHQQYASSAQALVDKLKPLTPRVYSIASAPHQAHIQLLVRAHQREDGSLGIASHFLCQQSKKAELSVAIRQHVNFHLPKSDVPLVMIAAGTGIAPFMGFLAHKKAIRSEQPTWLFYGEQHQQCDHYFEDELHQYQQQGVLDALYCAWSRDESPQYIGELVQNQAHQLIDLVNNQGGHIFVCGSRTGFGERILHILKMCFGEQQYEALVEQRKIRTDLY